MERYEPDKTIIMLREILPHYETVLKNKKRARALLMDLCPDNNQLRHALISCIDLSIPTDIRRKQSCSFFDYRRYIRQLINEYGYSGEVATKAVSAWLFIFGVVVEEQVKARTSSRLSETEYEILEGELRGEYIGINNSDERIIERDSIWYREIPFKIYRECKFPIHTEVVFNAVILGKYKYAYNLRLCNGTEDDNRPVEIVNSGRDIVHREGVVEKIESGRGQIYEATIDQRYIFGINKIIKDMNLAVGDKVSFVIGVVDGKMFATDLEKI